MNRLILAIFLLFLIIFLSSCQCVKNEPVCGANQKTYSNKCVAAISGVDSVLGECTVPSDCGCSAQTLK